MANTSRLEAHLRRLRARPDRSRALLLTEAELPADAAARAALMATIERDVDILFVEERILLKLLGRDLGAACAWLSQSDVLAVVIMGREAVVLIDGDEEIFAPPTPNFAVASGRYIDGFLAAVSEGKSPADCALQAQRRATRLDDQMRRLGH
jgi:sugar/nucleoside kinase (ribokinase family)